MHSLYTNDVAEYLKTRPFPKGFQWLVEEYIEPLPHLQFVMFRHNINEYPKDVILQIANTINETFMKLRKDGVPIYVEVR